MKDRLLYKILRPVFSIYMRLRYNPKITGMENIRDVIPYPRTPGSCEY